VLANALLVRLAQAPPRGLYDLSALGLSAQQIRLWGDEILQVLLTARSQEAETSLSPIPWDAQWVERVERLRAWRKRVAQQWGVESDIILPRTLLEALARLTPRTLDELQEVLHRSPWRFRTFGEALLQVLQEAEEVAPNHLEVRQ
jgi:Ribonuclease D